MITNVSGYKSADVVESIRRLTQLSTDIMRLNQKEESNPAMALAVLKDLNYHMFFIQSFLLHEASNGQK